MFFKLQILYYFLKIKAGRLLYEYNLMPIQQKRLQGLRRALKKSPYYRQMLNTSNDLSNAPLMNKIMFMHHFNEINTVGLDLKQSMEVAIKAETTRNFSPMINKISVGLSTGTSGNRGLFVVSIRERAIWVATILDRVIGFSLRKRKVAFFLRANNNLYNSSQSKLLQFTFFDIFMPMDAHLKALEKLQPNIIVAQPSVLSIIAEAIQQQTLLLSPQKIISVAEVLTPEDKKYFEGVFKQPIHQVYQCTEGFLAATCKEGTLHFNEDYLIIEKHYLNAEKTKFHPIITDLLRTSQPVIRYELNDIITIQNGCKCGSRMLAIASIEGRSDDMLVFTNDQHQEIKLFPDWFRKTIVLSDENISDYCLIQTNLKMLELYIKSKNSLSYDLASKAILESLKSHGISGVIIQKTHNISDTLGIKKRRIRNEISKAN